MKKKDSFFSCGFLVKGPCHSSVTEENGKFTWTQRGLHNYIITKHPDRDWENRVCLCVGDADYRKDKETDRQTETEEEYCA